jgi:type 1 glutamine amidotransferase
MTARSALVVRGGWEGHHPVEATELFIPFLEGQGFEVEVHESPEIYADAERMRAQDLVVQSVTMAQISREAVTGLRDAVADGLGLVGWHGGIADSFRNESDYLQLIGGQFATHPAKAPEGRVGDETDNYLAHAIEITEAGRSHPITAGIDDFELETEQYWVLHDDLIDVLATTTHPAPEWHPWHRPLVSPVVWTRSWGAGRIVVATPGHAVEILRDENVRTIIERGMLWASRTA